MKVSVKRTSAGAKLPVYQHPGDAGMDLFAAEEVSLGAGEVKPVPTGIKMAIPEGYVGLIWDKSGISLQGVHRLAGVVDAGYRGEVKVVMINLGKLPFAIKKGMKIAQMLHRSKRFQIQQFSRRNPVDKIFAQVEPYPEEEISRLAGLVKPYFDDDRIIRRAGPRRRRLRARTSLSTGSRSSPPTA